MRLAWKNAWISGTLWCIFVLPPALAQQAGNGSTPKEVRLQFRVTYVTPEAVYFEGGARDGLRPGDKVWVLRNGRKVMQIEVKYVAEHSACCVLETGQQENVGESGSVRVGDVILWSIPRQGFLERTKPSEEDTQRQALPSPPQKAQAVSVQQKQPLRPRRSAKDVVRGQVSVQAFGQHDNGAQRFDFFEHSTYLRLDLRPRGGHPWRFATRVRSSQNYRPLGARDRRRQPLLHRVYEVFLEYAPSQGPMEITLGRMLRSEMRGVGYLDGVAVTYRLRERCKVGLFGGLQPEPYRSGFRTDERKLGAFLLVNTKMGHRAEVTLAAAGIGRYVHREVSREYLTGEVDFAFARRLSLTQYCEIDLNRFWRRHATGRAVDLSNASINVTYSPSSWLTLGGSYDTRRLVRSWETRSLADSLFDDALRQGWRVSVSLQPSPFTRFAIDGGLQRHKDSPDVYSMGLLASVSNPLHTGMGISTRLSYFGNSLFAGYYPALDLCRNFFGLVYATVGTGAYVYRMEGKAKPKFNPWERLRLDINLTRSFFLSGTLENFHGDSMKYLRGFVEFGRRF